MCLKVLQIVSPMCPFVKEGWLQPIPSKRLRQEDSLDYERLASELWPNTIATLPLGQHYNTDGRKPMHCHSVVNVFSPYVPEARNAFHLMTINVGRAYTPSPQWIPDDIGSGLASAWATSIRFIAAQGSTLNSIGYNCSPIGFGFLEERLGGGQSLPTRFHMMITGEPPELRVTQGRWVEWDQLPAVKQRLFSGGNYAAALSAEIKQRALAALADPYYRHILEGTDAYAMGLRAPISCSLADLVERDGFFGLFLKPLSRAIEGMFRDLTIALTDLPYDDLMRLLQKTEDGPVPADLLRHTPAVRDSKEAWDALAAVGLSTSLVDILWEPVRRRCNTSARLWDVPLSIGERANLLNVWRKGFAYSVVLVGSGDTCELLIAPFVFTGDCGMMEAQKILLERPALPVSDADALHRSRPLYDLAHMLEDH